MTKQELQLADRQRIEIIKLEDEVKRLKAELDVVRRCRLTLAEIEAGKKALEEPAR